MSGDKRLLWLFALAMVLVMMSSSVRAQSSRIAFNSDRIEVLVGDLEVWLSNDDGSQQVLFSASTDPDSPKHRRPSICGDGQWVFFDDQLEGPFPQPPPIRQGDVWAKRTAGGGAAQRVLDCAAHSSPNCFGLPQMSIDWCPGHEPLIAPPPPIPAFNDECICRAVDCGPSAPGEPPANARILIQYSNPSSSNNIIMSTWDPLSESLGEPCKFTADFVTGPFAITPQNTAPAWCRDEVVFARKGHEFEEGVLADNTICMMNVATPSEPPVIRCHYTDDGLQRGNPSCGMVNARWMVVYDKQKPLATPSFRQICTIALDQSTFDFIPGTEVCTPDVPSTIDWSNPTLSPSGTQIVFAANMDEFGNPSATYDIYQINSDSDSLVAGGPLATITQNTDNDDAPDWGPWVLGP